MIIVHSPRCLEYSAFGHIERPERVADTVALLRQQLGHEWVAPTPAATADLRRVHSEELIRAVATGDHCDGDTPHFPQINEIARLAAGAAITAAERALTAGRAFSLMRPPGHHATRDRVMGFCYFNNIAVAVARLRARHRVAIVDFDCHHGNGTEDIFAGDDRVLFVSLHQSPCYPGTGMESLANCRNYALPPGTEPADYLATFDAALAEVRAFRPDLIAISAGFDAFAGDPITEMGLEIATFGEIGRRLSRLGGPQFGVLEGGYAAQLPACIASFLVGWES